MHTKTLWKSAGVWFLICTLLMKSESFSKTFPTKIITWRFCKDSLPPETKSAAQEINYSFFYRYLHRVTIKSKRYEKKVSRTTFQYLQKLGKSENKVLKNLKKIDSSLSLNTILSQNIDSLIQLRRIINNEVLYHPVSSTKQYLPYLDTLKDVLEFLHKGPIQFTQFKNSQQLLSKSLEELKRLENKIGKIDEIRKCIQKQQQIIDQFLHGYNQSLPNEIRRFNKLAYYYNSRLKNYQELFLHPDHLERRVIHDLIQIPSFSTFLNTHSQIALLFRIPEDYDNLHSLDGLQTRSVISKQIEQKLQSAGLDGRQEIQQQIAIAREKINKLQEKLSNIGTTDEIPDFTPKDIKSRTFFQRLERGANVGFNHTNGYFPQTTEIVGQLAYRMGQKSVIGTGLIFEIGWRGDIQKMHLSPYGLGQRFFMSYQLKRILHLNGGFEYQNNQIFSNVPSSYYQNKFTKRAFLGIERKYHINNKLNVDLMILYDFLYRKNIPWTQPVIFRAGYNF